MKFLFFQGNLYIHFNVEFPKPGYLNEQKIQQLEKILPPRRPTPTVGPDTEQVTLTKLSHYEQQQQKDKKDRKQKEVYQEDEDEESTGGGSRVQCAQQ